MTDQRRTPGHADVHDSWKKRDGTPSSRHGTGKRWQVRYIDDKGKRRSRFFTRKIDATQYRDHITTTLTRREYVAPEHGEQALADLYPAWLAIKSARWEDTTKLNHRSHWEKHLKADWGPRELASIKRSHVQSWVAEKHAEGVKTPTLRVCVGILRGVLDYAVDSGYLLANPADKITFPRQQQAQRPILTATQVELIARHIDHGATVVRFLAYTGLRFGEMAALTPADIDTTTRKISVTKNAKDVGGKIVTGSVKGHRNRWVPYPSALDAELETIIEHADELVFTSLERKVLRHNNFGPRHFKPAVTTAQDIDPTLPTVTLHDLRHTAASLAISSGANVKAVQRMLGHETATLTLDTYSDLFDDDLESVAKNMDRLIRSQTKGNSAKSKNTR